MMIANDAPRLNAYDEALKTRVLAVPFNHRLDGGPICGYPSATLVLFDNSRNKYPSLKY